MQRGQETMVRAGPDYRIVRGSISRKYHDHLKKIPRIVRSMRSRSFYDDLLSGFVTNAEGKV
jgi:hypothetical protein